jgi:hypothetical protein
LPAGAGRLIAREQGKHAPHISRMPGATQHPYEGCCIPWAARHSG